jgi:hypothetical protein
LTDYLQPGVYVEERSYRAKMIDGVATFGIGVLVGVSLSLLAYCIRPRCPGGRC